MVPFPCATHGWLPPTELIRHYARMNLNHWLLVVLAVVLVVLAVVGRNAWEMAHRTLETKF